MFISQDMYKSHRYHKLITDYFGDVTMTVHNKYVYGYKIEKLNFMSTLLMDTADVIRTNEDVKNSIHLKMNCLLINVIKEMAKQNGFDDSTIDVSIDYRRNLLKIALKQYHVSTRFESSIEKVIDCETFVFKRDISSDRDYVRIEKIDLYDNRSVTLLDIDLDNLSFEEIENKLEKCAKIKDQLILALQNM